jgi:hypothetical protein
MHSMVDSNDSIPFRVKNGAGLGECEFLEGVLFLKKTLIVEANRERAFHGAAAELKGQLNKSHARSTAIGFRVVRLRVKAESQRESSNDPAKGSHVVSKRNESKYLCIAIIVKSNAIFF